MDMLSPAEAAFAEKQRVAHLATADGSGQPHSVPVCFVYDEGTFYIAIDEKPKSTTRLKRLRNIEENPRVALVFDRYDEDWSQLGWVLVRGTAAVIDSGGSHARALSALRKKYGQYQSMMLEGRPVIAITPQTIRSWGKLD